MRRLRLLFTLYIISILSGCGSDVDHIAPKKTGLGTTAKSVLGDVGNGKARDVDTVAVSSGPYFLVRFPDWLQAYYGENFNEIKENLATLIVDENRQVAVGESFYIANHPTGVVHAVLAKIVHPKEFEQGKNKYSLGVLELDESLKWDGEFNRAYLAVTREPSPDSIGVIRELTKSEVEREDFLTQINPLIPAGHIGMISSALEIYPPGKTEKLFFVDYEYSAPDDQVGGSKAGFIFRVEDNRLRLLDKSFNTSPPCQTDSCFAISKIFAIVDIDGVGQYQILTHRMAGNFGKYDLELFDGNRIVKTEQSLYEWAD